MREIPRYLFHFVMKSNAWLLYLRIQIAKHHSHTSIFISDGDKNTQLNTEYRVVYPKGQKLRVIKKD